MRNAFGIEYKADQGDEIAHARSVRDHCDYCGSRAIELDAWPVIWPMLTPAQRPMLRRLARDSDLAGREESLVVWFCRSCDNMGMFSPWFSSI